MTSGMNTIDTVVFDVGNVLLDWNPRHLYRKLFDDAAEMEMFLSEICTPDWNFQQDLGRRWHEATEILIRRHPEKAALIRAYDERWEEMVAGAIDGSVALLRGLHANGTPLYAITNFSDEKFPLMTAQYDFFACFEDIVVSGTERTAKPAAEIFHIFLERSGRTAGQCLFIDDSELNIAGAQAVGFGTHHFRSPDLLRQDLAERGFPVSDRIG